MVQKPEPEQIIENKYEGVSINQLWGKVLIALRESNSPVLYTTCGEVTPLELINSSFKLQVNNKIMYNRLNKPENKKTLEQLLKEFEVETFVEIVLAENKPQTTSKINVEELLKQKFGSKLTIIN